MDARLWRTEHMLPFTRAKCNKSSLICIYMRSFDIDLGNILSRGGASLIEDTCSASPMTANDPQTWPPINGALSSKRTLSAIGMRLRCFINDAFDSRLSAESGDVNPTGIERKTSRRLSITLAGPRLPVVCGFVYTMRVVVNVTVVFSFLYRLSPIFSGNYFFREAF